MNFTILQAFRQGVYKCFKRAADALFNTVDALLTETTAHSFAELSLSPCFERQWPSLYEAFQDGSIDRTQLQQVMAGALPVPAVGKRLLLAVDATAIARPQSETSADRSSVVVHNLPRCKTVPITAGWHFATLVVLPEQPSSSCYVLDNRRIASSQTAGQVAAEQLRELMPLLPPESRPLLTADRGYGNAPFLQATHDIACDKLLRIAKNRVFYRPAPPPTGKRGAPRKDGDRFKCNDPSTHGEPDEHWQGPDEQGHLLQVDCWHGLHLQQARALPLSLIRLRRSRAATKRQPSESWFVWQGLILPPLGEIWALYTCRYSLEHSYRFDKQHLLWGEPRLRTPEQFERWTQVVAIVHNQLVLARSLVQAVRLPWESGHRPVTLQQVRRAMGGIIGMLGTPAQRVQPRGKSPGRLPGATVEAAQRFPVVFKPKSTPKKPGKAV